MYGSSC